jgi:hypothetical protein
MSNPIVFIILLIILIAIMVWLFADFWKGGRHRPKPHGQEVVPAPSMCATNTDCAFGEFCSNGFCTPGCRVGDTPACPTGYACDGSTGKCVPVHPTGDNVTYVRWYQYSPFTSGTFDLHALVGLANFNVNYRVNNDNIPDLSLAVKSLSGYPEYLDVEKVFKPVCDDFRHSFYITLAIGFKPSAGKHWTVNARTLDDPTGPGITKTAMIPDKATLGRCYMTSMTPWTMETDATVTDYSIYIEFGGPYGRPPDMEDLRP